MCHVMVSEALWGSNCDAMDQDQKAPTSTPNLPPLPLSSYSSSHSKPANITFYQYSMKRKDFNVYIKAKKVYLSVVEELRVVVISHCLGGNKICKMFLLMLVVVDDEEAEDENTGKNISGR